MVQQGSGFAYSPIPSHFNELFRQFADVTLLRPHIAL